MKSIPFGYRFYLTVAISFVLAELWAGISLPTGAGASLDDALAGLFHWSVALVYYGFLNLILKARIPKTPYIIYLLVGVFVGCRAIGSSLALIEALGSVTSGDGHGALAFALVVPLALALLPPLLAYWLEWFREHPWYRQFLGGAGGSSRWGTVKTTARHPAKLEQRLFSFHWMGDSGVTSPYLFMGRSLLRHDPFPRLVGINDDSHCITIAGIRTGKRVSVIAPVVSTHMADMVIFDPKGEHAKDTFQRRCSAEFLTAQGIAHDGTKKHLPYGEAHVLDPCGITGRKSARHTLLSEIDINAPNCRELIVAIADGCILPEAEKNKWFEEGPKSLLQGLIAYVLGRFPDEPGKQTLPYISDLVYGVNEDGFSDPALFNELLLDMMTCSAAGGLPQQAASELLKMGERERGQVLSALARGLKWVGDPAMRVQLSHSDFSFSEVGNKTVIGADGAMHKATMTVYIVLPDTRISDLNRWFRCIASLGSVAMRRRPVLPDLATLWIMDEFALLGGGLKTISDGYGLFAGYKIKLWIFLQNLGQLQHDYPERWNAMVGNANAQFFGISMMDTVTAKFISEAVGRLNRVRTEGRHGLFGLFRRRMVSETPREMLTPSEVATLIGKGSNKQIFFPANDGHPMLLERLVFRPMKVGGRKLCGLPLDGLRGHFNDF